MQVRNIANGINKVGIPDVVIVQNAIQCGIPILTYDKHFALMQELFGFDMYEQ